MNIKANIIAFSLAGLISSLSMAENSGQEILQNNANTRFFNHVAVNVINTDADQASIRYKILISKAVTKPNPDNDIIAQNVRPTIQAIDKPIWMITSDQLPITQNDCNKANIDTCLDEDHNCYKSCLTGLDPEIVAFDEKANKLYFMIGSHAIGTGGGPSFLFVGDVNKKEIKLLLDTWDQEDGSLSPSGRYLALYGFSIVRIYDTHTNTNFYINDSMNVYTDGKEIRHYLNVKRWLNDTQFSYIDVGRYFTHKTEPQPFMNAKEVIYDISTRKVVHERAITEEESKQT